MTNGEQKPPKTWDGQTFFLPNADDPNRILIQKFKLLMISGPLQGQEFLVDKTSFTIGSGTGNDLVLKDSTISRRHCEIQISPQGYVVRDLGSTNGTFVQGVRVTEAYLERGTEFQLGHTRIVFCPSQGTLEYTLSPNESFGAMLGRSAAMRRVFHLAETYAPTEATVLIEGETGTGKEVLAEEIHHHSRRASKPLVVIDCTSLSKELVASELFGHVKGAFTGAQGDRVGAFEHANGGTVFLDEIADLSPELQPQLLRVLEKREVRRTGTNELRKVDVRIVCATNRNLRNEVNQGRFREDLYFRLSVVALELPPLRQRKSDIPLLAEKFLTHFLGGDAMSQVTDFEKTVQAFRNYDWPGNVRELRNVVEMACLSERRPLDVGAFLYWNRARPPVEGGFPEIAADRPFKDVKNELVTHFEREYIRGLLSRHDGNISRAAREAGIERTYLQRLVGKHDLKV